MRRSYRIVDGKLEEIGAQELRTDANLKFSSDDMAPTAHPATGEIFTSKSKFRARTQSLGMVEVGNEYANGYRERADDRAEKAARAKRIDMLREYLD